MTTGSLYGAEEARFSYVCSPRDAKALVGRLLVGMYGLELVVREERMMKSDSARNGTGKRSEGRGAMMAFG